MTDSGTLSSRMVWEAASATDPGRVRRNNEDALFVREDPGFFAVADGMGGHAAGEVASRMAIESLVARLDEAARPLAAAELTDAFEEANRAILDRATDQPSTRGMGTTLTALAADAEEGHALIAHVGDSRLYRWRDGALEPLTRDHTWVQENIDAGVLTPAQARNHPFSSVLTRVLGTTASATPDIERISVAAGDLFLLCSDGLSGMLEDHEIAAVLAGSGSLDRKAVRLVARANENGGGDNITVILVRAQRPGRE